MFKLEKRTQLILLILFGLLLFALGLYLLLTPILNERRVVSPPGAAGGTPYVPQIETPSTPSTPEFRPGTSIPVSGPEADGIRTLEIRASSVIERLGSGASYDGFLGYQDVMNEVTQNLRNSLLAEQEKMRQEHPKSGSMYGISTRVVSSIVKEGTFGDDKIIFVIEVLQKIDAGDPAKPTSTEAKRINLAFLKQGENKYLIDSLEWSDIEL